MPKVPNVYPMENGTFRASVSLGFDPQTGKRIRKFKNGFKTQKEAQLWQAKMLNDFGKGALSQNSTMTFHKFLIDFFIPDYQSKVRERTFDMAKSKIKRLSYWDNFKLSDISAPRVKQWQNSLFEENLSNNYIRSIFQVFKQVLDLAVQLGMLTQNVAKMVGNVKKEKPKNDHWTKEEFEKFISTFDRKNNIYDLLYFTTFWFFYMTGVRIGELQALTWHDIDWVNQSVIVNKSMYYKNKNNWEITEPKTSNSIRLLYLDNDTLQILKDWKFVQKQIGDIDFIFSVNNLPVIKSTLKRVISRHSHLAGVKKIRVHDLRHSDASLMLELGMNILEIQKRLGHADIQTTLGTYSHLRPTAMKNVANRLSGQIKISDSFIRENKFHGNQHTINFKP
jgi:integrase